MKIIFSGELWTERVMLYYVENVPGAWANKANIKSVLIGEKFGNQTKNIVVSIGTNPTFKVKKVPMEYIPTMPKRLHFLVPDFVF